MKAGDIMSRETDLHLYYHVIRRRTSLPSSPPQYPGKHYRKGIINRFLMRLPHRNTGQHQTLFYLMAGVQEHSLCQYPPMGVAHQQ